MIKKAEMAEGGGNSNPPPVKRVSSRKLWCFTLNNYTIAEMAELAGCFEKKDCEWIFGEEIGDSGTPHLQGFVYFNSKAGERPIECLKLSHKRVHWIACKGSKESNVKYCIKDNKYQFGGEKMKSWINIEKQSLNKYVVHLDKIHRWEQNIINVINSKPTMRDIHWVYETVGGIGKTEFQKYLLTNFENIIILGGKSSDMKNAIVDYNSKLGILPTTILINIPRAQRNRISYTGLEELKDMVFYSGKYEGGMICGPRPHIIIFANYEPKEFEMSADKFIVHDIYNDPILHFIDELIEDSADKCYVHGVRKGVSSADAPHTNRCQA